MIYPQVLDFAANGYPVAVTCRVLALTTQGYNKWRRNPVSERDWYDAHLANAAYDIHKQDPTFGYRFIADQLFAAGFKTSERRVWRVCSETKIWSVLAKKKTLYRKTGLPVCDDLVQRNFKANKLNQLWLADITEHPTKEGKLYFCAIKDVFSKRIVGYCADSRMKATLAVKALRNAIILRSPKTTVVHSDRGSQFRSAAFRDILANNKLQGSMGKVGACADNAAMESFFSLLQKNVLNQQTWDTRNQLRLAIITWIERTYHRRRRQRSLGRLTPVEFEILNK